MLSIGSVAAEPADRLSNDHYWFVQAGDTTGTNYDGETLVRTLAAGDTIAYCTLERKQFESLLVRNEQGDPILEEDGSFKTITALVFNKQELCQDIPDGSGYFVKMSAKFTPRGTPNVTASGDFPYRTLLYVTENNHLAFLERKEGELAAQEVVTDLEVAADTFLNITVQILKNNTFRVYVEEAEVTVNNGKKRPYRSLQNGEGQHYYADKLHSFAFTGSVEFKSIDFTTVNPFTKTVTSIPFKFEYDGNALSNVDGVVDTLDLTANKTYTVSFTRNTDQYDFLAPTLTGNSATLGDVTDDSITFTVTDNLTDDNPLVLTLPSKAYFFTLNDEKYGSFAEIFEAAQTNEDKTVSITHDINLDDAEVSPGAQAFIKDGQEIVLDLMGKTIKGVKYRSASEDAAILNRGSLKIIDSVGGGKIEANGFVITTGSGSFEENKDNIALENDANETIIKAGIFCGVVTNVAGRIQIDGGKFLKVFAEDTKEDFYLSRQAGVSIGARFDEADFTTLDGQEFWTGDEATDLIEFRVETPSYATLTQKLYAKDDYVGGSRPTVTAAGYKVDEVELEWSEPDEYGIVRGELTPITYAIVYDTADKATLPTDAPTSYTVDSETIVLPKLENELWSFEGWFAEDDKKVASLGEFATYVGSANLVLGNDEQVLNLVAKWKPIEKAWTNAMTGDQYMSMTEANGFYPDSTKWQFTLPATNGFELGDVVSLKSITLSTVNASPKNLERMAAELTLQVGGKNLVVRREEFVASHDEFDPSLEPSPYFKTNFGFRPKIVYTFKEPATIIIGTPYNFTLSNNESSVLLRLVKKTGNTEFQIIGAVGAVPSTDYQTYVPMYKIVVEAIDTNEGAN